MHRASFLLAFGVLCCSARWSSSAVVADGPQRDAATVDPKHAIDPELEALAAESSGLGRDDRGKRQLSSVQSKLLNFLKPLPVVDVTKEEEKYGNDGDKFNRFGRSFINGVEKVSSVLTSTISFPVDTAKTISRKTTEVLNNLGGRLVGLQR